MVTRADIVAAADSWRGTPYRHQAALKGVGCDCLGLVRGVWRDVYGDEPETPPAYPADWSAAGSGDLLSAAAGRHLEPVDIAAIAAGDVLLFRWQDGQPARHAGILISARRFLHAHAGAVVAEAPLVGWWRRHLAGAYRYPGVEG